jgi:beta-1,4-glucosyltransferase
VAELVPMQNRNETKLFFFINVNSINQARSSEEFTAILNSSNMSYADGSGMRIGARRIGVSLRDNLNGTDLFPHICQRAQDLQKSVYLLGAEPGVADAAAQWVSNHYPTLDIAGVQHGYFSPEESEAVVEAVNESGADILLVAMGSPVQEGWLIANKSKLKCVSALAVGGLFDFYSGRISRAPIWIRELGMEWIWRLANEPVKKFNRYVIGNPRFIYGLFSKAPDEVGQTLK